MRKLMHIFTAVLVLLFNFSFHSAVCFAEEAEEDLPIYCTGEKCTVVIESVSANAPKVTPETLEINNGNIGKFHFKINEPGVYTYRVYQKATTDSSIEFDNKSFEVSVSVLYNTQSKLIVSITVKNSATGEKPDKIEFNNRKKQEDKTPSQNNKTNCPDCIVEARTGAESSHTLITAIGLIISGIIINRIARRL